MKKILMSLFCLLVVFGTITTVLAGATGDVGSGPGSDTNESNKHTIIPYVDGKDTFAGARISFVNSKGEYVYHVDYSGQDITIGTYNNLKVTSGGYSKTEYVGTNDPIFNVTKSKDNIYNDFSALETLLNNNGFKGNELNLSKNIYGYDNLNYDLFETMFSKENYNGDDYEKDLTNAILAMSSSNPDVSSYLNDLNINDLFMVVEPTTIFVINGEPYYGTIYELAQEVENQKVYNYIGNDAFTNYFCSANATGNLSKEIDNEYITEDSYFGDINITKDSECTVKNELLSKSQILNNTRFGMGVIAFSKDWNKEPLTCDLLHQYTGTTAKYCDDVEGILGILTTFNKSDASKIYGTIERETYDSCCLPPEEEPIEYDCTPFYQVGSCSGSLQIKYNDVSPAQTNQTEFWNNCVYNQGASKITPYKTPTGPLPYRDDSVMEGANNYCEVYCVETLDTNFKTSLGNILAGRYMDWPNGSSINGSRTCKLVLTEDSWGKYTDDLEEAVLDTINNYNIYSEYSARYDVLSNYKKTSDACECKNASTPTVTCYELGEMDAVEGATIDTNSIILCSDMGLGSDSLLSGKYEGYKITSTTKGKSEEKNLPLIETNPTIDETTNLPIDNPDIPNETSVEVIPYTYELYKCNSWYYYYETDKEYGSYTYYDDFNYEQDKVSYLDPDSDDFRYSSMICENEYNSKLNSVANTMNNAYKNYKYAQEQAAGYTTAMQRCYSWSDKPEKIYQVNPNAILTSVDNGYSFASEEDALKQLSISSSVTLLPADELDITCKSNEDYYYICNASGCEEHTLEVNDCSAKGDPSDRNYESNVTSTVSAKISISLNPNLYRYIRKSDNKSMSSVPSTSYIDLGMGNLPIAYSLRDGAHGMTFVYSNLGHTGNLNGNKTAVDSILSANGTGYGTWSCTYNSTSKLITSNQTNSGINVIYRTIDLNNPFPDINGDGRKVGSNWCDGGDCTNDNKVIQDVIKSTDMSATPMYSFTLTPKVIKKIRDYNDSKKSYTEYDLQCETSTGKACISQLLTDLINDESITTSGRCTSSTTRVNISSSFYGCERTD